MLLLLLGVLLFSPSLGWAFPSTGVLANLNIANEDPLSFSGKFTCPGFTGDANLKIVSNVAALSTGTGLGDCYYNTSTFGPVTTGVEVYATVSTASANSSEQVYLDMVFSGVGTASYNSYELIWNYAGGNTSTMRLDRYDAAARTSLIASIPIGNALASGDMFGFAAVNGTLTVYYCPAAANCRDIGSTNDSTYTGSASLAYGIGNVTNRIDDLGGGTFVATQGCYLMENNTDFYLMENNSDKYALEGGDGGLCGAVTVTWPGWYGATGWR